MGNIAHETVDTLILSEHLIESGHRHQEDDDIDWEAVSFYLMRFQREW